MRQCWENIWSFRTKNFRVDYDVTDEDDLDLSWDEDGCVRQGLQSGKYVAFQARVAVYWKGHEIGADYLGGCIYENVEQFMDHRGIKRQPNCGSYFTDMIRTAIKEARREMCKPRPVMRGA
jgi:hypothetical protein